jgi:hypothetical protein
MSKNSKLSNVKAFQEWYKWAEPKFKSLKKKPKPQLPAYYQDNGEY